ncbi:hypothetical protein AGMMS49940_06840 [Spirochaetia bacterium]|nr:hypothetical protein AGMMS49940_06840 [Spirochaetia bacterium]
MKKYKSPAFKHIHETALDFYKDGLISAAEMREFDEDCLVPKADTSTPSAGDRSPMVAAGSTPHEPLV